MLHFLICFQQYNSKSILTIKQGFTSFDFPYALYRRWTCPGNRSNRNSDIMMRLKICDFPWQMVAMYIILWLLRYSHLRSWNWQARGRTDEDKRGNDKEYGFLEIFWSVDYSWFYALFGWCWSTHLKHWRRRKNFFALQNWIWKIILSCLLTVITGFLKNSFKITVITIILILIFVPSVSYSIARNFNRKYYKTIYFYIMMGYLFRRCIVACNQMMSKLNMLNHADWLFCMWHLAWRRSISVCKLYQRSPYEIESAQIDGCSISDICKNSTSCKAYDFYVADHGYFVDLEWLYAPLLILNRSRLIWTLPLFSIILRQIYSFNYTMAFTHYLLCCLCWSFIVWDKIHSQVNWQQDL